MTTSDTNGWRPAPEGPPPLTYPRRGIDPEIVAMLTEFAASGQWHQRPLPTRIEADRLRARLRHAAKRELPDATISTRITAADGNAAVLHVKVEIPPKPARRGNRR